MSDLNITGKPVESIKSLVILEVDGFIDGSTSSQLKAAFAKLLENNISKVIIDCSKLLYMSSAGFGVFMGAIDMFNEKSGEFVISTIPTKIFEIFETLGLQNLISFFNTTEEAIQYFLNKK